MISAHSTGPIAPVSSIPRYCCSAITAALVFGPKTKAAVIALQQYLGIEETGAIGPVEWAEIITLGNNL